MSENIIIIATIATATALVAIPFTFRAFRYRRRLKTPEVTNPVSDWQEFKMSPSEAAPAQAYFFRYILRDYRPFRSDKTIKIRQEYYDSIRDIIRTIGHGRITMIGYLDEVLRAHFEEHEKAIDLLSDRKSDDR